jgi:hypothetical protein
MQTSKWASLSIPGTQLAEARLQCHHAAQLNTRLARGFVAAQPDDSHTSMVWDVAAAALVGRPVSSFRLGLRIPDLTLVLLGSPGETIADFPLDGRTFADGLGWLGERLRAIGLDPAPLALPIHFSLDDHPLLHGAAFRLHGSEPLFEELAKWYGNAAWAFDFLSSPLRCWPHHFDIAASIAKGKSTVGVGMSPGDKTYDQPYFYVTPWPYPEAASLPPLTLGHWHTEGWTGAVLMADEVLSQGDQPRYVREFLDTALAAVR